MSQPRLRVLLRIVQYGLCVAAIAWLIHIVPWHDHVHLADGATVRLLEQRADGFVIQRDGQAATVPPEAVQFDEVGDERLPLIEYGISSVFHRMDKQQALLAILIFLPASLIQSGRLVVMLLIQGVRVSLWAALKLTFVGNFFNFALPGTTGGDLIKAYYITLYTHRKTEVVTTVFLDRAIGLLGLVLVAGTAVLLTRDPNQFGQLVTTLGAVMAALALGAIVVFSRRIREALRLRRLAEMLPFGDQIVRVGRATVAMRAHKGLVLASLGMTVVLQVIVMISAVVMARALGMQGDSAYYFIYVSIGFLIAAIPITPPQAFGVMEYFYVLFFTQHGLNNDASQAVALALAVRLTQLVWALPGVLVPIFGAHLPRKAELSALDEGSAPAEGAAISH